ncbi:AMP-dependent synthetase [Rhodophyticola sp. CCM32]|nr:AMP-dependent synthetase [Rhodophyticola sp. CCM32]
MLPRLKGRSYEALRDGFAWDLPGRLNMAAQVLDHPGEALAIRDLSAGQDISFGALRLMAGQLAAALRSRSVKRGDRVGVLRGQDGWCAAAHIAIWQLGAISVPLFKLFREDALSSRLADSGAGRVISDGEGAGLLAAFDLDVLVPETETLPPRFGEMADTGPEDPAVLIYTSGTTGSPKGALHGHRVLTGHLPGVEISHDFLGQPGDVIWTPADWAWIGGLFDVLMPGLALGVPVVAARMPKFTVAACLEICRKGAVRNVFFPPTALRMLKAAEARIDGLRSVASGGEPLGAAMLDWGRRAFDLEINEFYGQTECNMIVSSCSSLFPAKPGAIGRPVPGHEVAVIGADGRETQEEGDVAVRRGSASMMLSYWQKPQETADKFRGDWMLTGDRGLWEGPYLRFMGREDDVITSAGYRIGPAEIEDCLLSHPGVASAGVVSKPDALRTEIVKAYVVAKDGADITAGVLQDWVKGRLASYSYPREISFVEALPMTVTGKVIRKDLKALAVAEQENGA